MMIKKLRTVGANIFLVVGLAAATTVAAGAGASADVRSCTHTVSGHYHNVSYWTYYYDHSDWSYSGNISTHIHVYDWVTTGPFGATAEGTSRKACPKH